MRSRLKHPGLWFKHTVSRILKTETYTGTFIQNRYTGADQGRKKLEKPKEEWIIHNCPVIITPSLFERAQHQLAQNKKLSMRNQNKSRTYLLKGLVECGETGYRYLGYYSHSSKSKHYRLSVNRHKAIGIKKQSSISAKKLEPLVWEEVERILRNPETLEKQLQQHFEQKKQSKDLYHNPLSMLQSKQTTLQQNINGLLNLAETMASSDLGSIRSRLATYQQELQQVHIQIEQVQEQNTNTSQAMYSQWLTNFQETSKKLVELLDQTTEAERAHLCRCLIEKVVLTGNEVEIRLRIG